MNKRRVIIFVAAALLLAASSGSWAEESGCYHPSEGWLLRAYSAGAGPFSLYLMVTDRNGVLVPSGDVKAFANPQNPCANPCLFESGATNPDISLSFDEFDSTAYIFHDRSGQLVLTKIPEIAYNAPALPVMNVNPTSVNYGEVRLSVSVSKTVTVYNTGTAPLRVSSVGSPSQPFAIVSENCTGSDVSPGGSCGIIVNFSPTQFGSFSSGFVINSNGGNASVSLAGNGSRK